MKFPNSMRFRITQSLALISIVASLFLLSFSLNNDAKKEEMVVLTTEYGSMTIRLYDETPRHKENFLKLVKENYYDSLLFHRVIGDFMIQGGDPESRNAAPGLPLGNGGPGYTLPAEFHPELIHKKGALAAARQGDQVNPEKRSSGSQFYIVQGRPIDSEMLASIRQRSESSLTYSEEQKEIYAEVGGTPHLDGSYTVFGEVVEGLDVLDTISALPTDRRNRPVKDVWMTMEIKKLKWP